MTSTVVSQKQYITQKVDKQGKSCAKVNLTIRLSRQRAARVKAKNAAVIVVVCVGAAITTNVKIATK